MIPAVEIPADAHVDIHGIVVYPGYCMSWNCHQPATHQWASDGDVLWAVCSSHRSDPLIDAASYVTVY